MYIVSPEQSKPVIGLAPAQTYGTPRYRSAIAAARLPIDPEVADRAAVKPRNDASAEENPSAASGSTRVSERTAPDRDARAAAGTPRSTCVPAGTPKAARPTTRRSPTRPIRPRDFARWSTTA